MKKKEEEIKKKKIDNERNINSFYNKNKSLS